jgi:nucleoside-diphosphate-sugar epimerase
MQIVFGATKGIGSAIVRELHRSGQAVRGAARRRPEHGSLLPDGIDFVSLDAADTAAVKQACEGAKVVYHCINVPYGQWQTVLPAATEAILEGAVAAGARLLFIGNIYGYGRLQKIPADERHPLAATTRKGRLRNELEEKLLSAQRAGKIKVVIPRFPDFFGPGVVNGLMAPVFEGGLSGKKALWPASLDVKHDLIYVEDAAAACVRLATGETGWGQAWHVPGPGAITGRQFLEMVFDAAGQQAKIGTLSQWMLRLGGLFNSDARELIEMLYEFSEPLVLDGRKFAAQFPDFTFTPHRDAVRKTLDWFRAER